MNSCLNLPTFFYPTPSCLRKPTNTLVSVAVEVNSDRGAGVEMKVAGNGSITRGLVCCIVWIGGISLPVCLE